MSTSASCVCTLVSVSRTGCSSWPASCRKSWRFSRSAERDSASNASRSCTWLRGERLALFVDRALGGVALGLEARGVADERLAIAQPKQPHGSGAAEEREEDKRAMSRASGGSMMAA